MDEPQPPYYGFRVDWSDRAPLDPFVRGLRRRGWLRYVRIGAAAIAIVAIGNRLISGAGP